MAEQILHDLYRYCKEHIYRFEDKVSLAWDEMDEWRCPLEMADDSLYYEMMDAIEDYCNEHDLDPDEFDVEEVFCAGEKD